MKVVTPTEADRDAWARAIAIARTESTLRSEQIDHKLASEGYEATGKFCAGLCQDASLDLQPWQPPPCADYVRFHIADHLRAGDDGITGRFGAAKIARRLIELGLSIWEPAPLRAIRAAEAAAKAS
jgi:hypothetical protein